MKPTLREVKQKVDSEEFEPAMKLAELAVALTSLSNISQCHRTDSSFVLQLSDASLDAAEKFFLYSARGNCALQLGQVDVGEKSLLEASKLTGAPTIQIQKVWKSLADLYEKTERWASCANATSKLYDIVLEKGNQERAQTLAVYIADCYSKCDVLTALQEGLEFIEKVLANRICSSVSDQVISLVGSIGRVVSNLEQAREKAATRSLSSTVQVVVDYNQEHVVAYLHDALREVAMPSQSCAENDGIISLLTRHLKYTRKSFMLGEKLQKHYYATSIAATRILGNTQKIFPFLVESFFVSDDVPFDEINVITDAILSSFPDDIGANIVKAFMLIIAGKVTAAGTHLSICLSFWRAKPKTETMLPSSILSIDDMMRTLALVCLVIGNARGEFVDLPVADTLYFINEALRRVTIIEEKVGLFPRGISQLVFISCLVGFCSVGQIKLAVDESNGRLRNQVSFPVVASTEVGYELNPEYKFSADCTLLIWLCLIFLRRVEHYEIAIALAETFASVSVISSFALCEKLFCETLREIKTKCIQQFTDNLTNLSPSVVTFRDITVNSTTTNSLISAYNDMLRMESDPLFSEIELLIRSRLGILMWISGGQLREDKTMCSVTFLSCAKLNPNFSLAYTFLGHFYSLVSKDIVRAEKCYARALALYPLDVDAGYCLSKLYLDNEQEDKAVALWDSIDDVTSSHSFWSASLKAFYLLNKGDIDAAVDKFHRALEIDHRVSSWAGLGFAYAIGHQNVSAQRTLLKALELQPSHPILLTTLGEIERRLCLFDEAAEHFNAALQISDSDELALKGIADVSLALAYQHLSIGWTYGVTTALLHGVQCAEKVLVLRSDSNGCMYKLLGDLCTFAYHISPSDIISEKSIGLSFTEVISLMRKGFEAYLKRLDVSQSSEAYYDLGCSLYLQATLCLYSRGQGSGLIATSALFDKSVKSLLTQASEYFGSGIKKDPQNSSDCWNGLALCVSDQEHKKYCLKRAIQIDNNSGACTNLAVNYLFHGLYDESRKCFSDVQAKDSNPMIWAGLGNIFEMLSDAEISNSLHAYEASIEVAKPADALLSSAVAFLCANAYLDKDGRLSDPSVQYSQFCRRCAQNSVKHNVEVRLGAYVRRRPVHPYAWYLLGWSKEFVESYKEATASYRSGLKAVDVIYEYVMSKDAHDVMSESEISASKSKIAYYAESFISGICRCEYMIQIKNIVDTGQAPVPLTLTEHCQYYESLKYVSSVVPVSLFEKKAIKHRQILDGSIDRVSLNLIDSLGFVISLFSAGKTSESQALLCTLLDEQLSKNDRLAVECLKIATSLSKWNKIYYGVLVKFSNYIISPSLEFELESAVASSPGSLSVIQFSKLIAFEGSIFKTNPDMVLECVFASREVQNIELFQQIVIMAKTFYPERFGMMLLSTECLSEIKDYIEVSRKDSLDRYERSMFLADAYKLREEESGSKSFFCNCHGCFSMGSSSESKATFSTQLISKIISSVDPFERNVLLRSIFKQPWILKDYPEVFSCN